MGKLSVALQLYTVRDVAEGDLKGTLAQVKEMGYDTVELAGTYGMTGTELKAVLDEAGLAALSAHVGLREFDPDMEACVVKYKNAGCTYVAIPSLPQDMRPGAEGFDKTLQLLTDIGAMCNKHGLTLLYHNHDFEFVKMPDGSYGLDYLFNAVPAGLLQTQIDTCWVKFAGLDPAEYVRGYAGRIPIVHLKDYVLNEGGDSPRSRLEFRPVGHGCQDFEAILKVSEEGGAAWVVVEQDFSVGRTTLEAAKMSRDYLKSLGY